MRQKVKNAIKAIIFVIILLAILAVCSFIAQPVWNSQNYNSPYGLYKEPSNTIETVFLGSSQVYSGISPIDLYDDYGICAYDLSTDGQSLCASYYWLEEIYRLHEQTLDTVVIDATKLLSGSGDASNHKAIDPMRFSLTKLRAVKAYSKNFEDFLQNMFPLLSYHDRWEELSKSDFIKFEQEPELFLRGYFYRTYQAVSSANEVTDLHLPLLIAEEDEDEQELALNDMELQYFKKMVSFCEDHDIQIVLIKTPTEWTSAEHNAVQELADVYGLDFIDFNIEPYYSDIEYNLAADSVDAQASNSNIHANYYGAMKLTDYMGRYLIEKCGNRDVRGDERYAFMEDELNDYRQFINSMQSFLQAADPCEYIEDALKAGDYTIIISVKDDAAASLTEEQRDYFESIGLDYLSQLTYRASYLAVIDDGNIITEKYKEDPGVQNSRNSLLEYSGTLNNGTEYTVTSGGHNLGNNSSIVFGETDRSNNKKGLNIVIYDNEQQHYIDSADFDTSDSPERSDFFDQDNWETLLEEGVSPASLTGTDYLLYLYNRACENKKLLALTQQRMYESNDLPTYLKAFWDDRNIDIFITIQGNVSEILTDSTRTSLSRLGLSELSQLSSQDSYVAAINGGEIMLEKSDYSTIPLEVSFDNYALKSIGRKESGDHSSVIINGTEYPAEREGIFVVIYDNITEMIVDTYTFGPDIDNVVNAEKVAG